MMQRLKCLLGFHDMRFEYAKDRREDEYTRQQRTDDGWVSEPVDACMLVDVCQHCGAEDEILAPASVADRRDLWR